MQNDDYFLKLVLTDPPLDREWSRSPLNAFAFINGDEELIRNALDFGRIPWWTHPQLKLAFLRPVTSMTHWVDFNIWPNQPWLMHLQSLMWLASAIAAAAILYRRLMLPAWIAGLAGLLFAVDDGHGMPAVWLANRNASIGVFFGLVALIAHDRWRREGWRPGAWLAPVALLLGLLSGEIALAACGYLFAYAVFIDPGRWRQRLMSLVPGVVVGTVWWVSYRLLDYGATGSGVYIDPGASPVEFVRAAIERAPMLFSGLWVLPSGLSLFLSRSATDTLWLVTVVIVVVIALLLRPILKRDRVACFFALGMVVSLVPACATFPDDRLLFFAGFGGMGLMAQFLAAVWRRDDWVPSSRIRRIPLAVAVWLLVFIHLVLSPLSLGTTASRVRIFGTIISRSAASLPADPEVTNQTAVIVNSPSVFFSIYGPLMQGLEGRPVPSRVLTLGSGIYPTVVSRPTPSSVTIHPEGGFLVRPGTPRPGHEASQTAFHPAYFHQMLDHLYRDSTPLRVGDRIAYGGAILEIIEATDAGRPTTISARFDVDLDDPTICWLQWKNGVYEPFRLPAVGETVTLPSVVVPWQ